MIDTVRTVGPLWYDKHNENKVSFGMTNTVRHFLPFGKNIFCFFWYGKQNKCLCPILK